MNKILAKAIGIMTSIFIISFSDNYKIFVFPLEIG
jgi:hypothetical protein